MTLRYSNEQASCTLMRMRCHDCRASTGNTVNVNVVRGEALHEQQPGEESVHSASTAEVTRPMPRRERETFEQLQ